MKKALFLLIFFTLNIYSTEYKIDQIHSYVGFKVKYLSLSNVIGRFDQFKGTVFMKDKNIESINGEINVSSINTNNEKRDAHLKSSDFFNLELYPKIKFKSIQVSKSDPGYVAIGELEIHGIKRIVSIPFELTDPLIGMKGDMRLGLTGALKINRKNYGLTYSKKMDNGGLIVDDFVDIEMNIQLVKEAENEASTEVI